MRITDLLMEEGLKDTPILSIGDSSITVGDIQNIVPDASPAAIIQNAAKIKDLVDKYGETALTAASLIPYVRYGMAARGGMLGLAKAVGSSEVTKAVGKQALKNIDVLPDNDNDNTGPNASASPSPAKKKKYKVGDMAPAMIGGKPVKLPVKAVLPNGYDLDASKVPGNKQGATVSIPEPL